MTTTDESALTLRPYWIRSFLGALAGALGVSGVICWVTSILTQPDGVLVSGYSTLWAILLLGLLAATPGLLWDIFRVRLPLGLRVICYLIAAGTLFVGVNLASLLIPRLWHVRLDGEPAVIWMATSMTCLSAGALTMTLHTTMQEQQWLLRPKGHPWWRTGTAMLCGVLAAVLGVAVAAERAQHSIREATWTTTTTSEQPQGSPEVFDARQATGEVVWTYQSPRLRGMIEVHSGVSGPIVADRNTVVGLDSATGKQLWAFEHNRAELEPLWRVDNYEQKKRRLVVSLDGKAVAFVACDESDKEEVRRSGRGPMLTVLDAATGEARFTHDLSAVIGPDGAERESSRCNLRVSMTDHVVVADGVAYDLVTGQELWQAPEDRKFVAGTNGASHLMIAEDPNKVERPLGSFELREECENCSWWPREVVSDRDPATVVHRISSGVTSGNASSPQVLLRGWLLEHDRETQENTWVNIDTQQRVPAGNELPYRKHRADGKEIVALSSNWVTDTAAFTESREARTEAPHPYLVFDPWTIEAVTTWAENQETNQGWLGVGVWTRQSYALETFQLLRPDGSPAGEPITPPAPPGKIWEHTGSIRTPHGIVSGFAWGFQNHQKPSTAIIMHR